MVLIIPNTYISQFQFIEKLKNVILNYKRTGIFYISKKKMKQYKKELKHPKL